MLSRGIIIRTSDSHSVIDKINKKRLNIAKSVYIGNHTWIGQNVTILKGVRLGSNIVVGNGAIVTKSFLDSNIVIGGNPGNIIKNGIDWDRALI